MRPMLDQQLLTLAQSELHALLATTGISVRPAEPLPDSHSMDLVTVVAFSGDELRGSIGLAGTTAWVRDSSTVTPRHDRKAQVTWLGALGLQLADRLRRRLERRGVFIEPATPLVVEGSELRLAAGGLDLAFHQPFCTDRGSGALWMQAMADHRFVLPEPDECEDEESTENRLLKATPVLYS